MWASFLSVCFVVRRVSKKVSRLIFLRTGSEAWVGLAKKKQSSGRYYLINYPLTG